jgi:2-dehydro-3-deoxyphosphogluconate aldolase/(4S)-4-hydroxy-2-oxoglutarate aldolase
MVMRELRDIMGQGPVIPVLVIEQLADAISLARALLTGGIGVLEVTLRTDAALAAIREISQVLPEAIIGAGTALNEEQIHLAAEAGAQFIVSPGLTPLVANAAASVKLPLLAGVATASDVMRGLELGLKDFKFFPAEAAGGVGTLKSLQGPFPDVRFCPTGGISLARAPAYLGLPNVLCVGGSWIAPSRSVAEGDWGTIEKLAREAAGLRRT